MRETSDAEFNSSTGLIIPIEDRVYLRNGEEIEFSDSDEITPHVLYILRK